MILLENYCERANELYKTSQTSSNDINVALLRENAMRYNPTGEATGTICNLTGKGGGDCQGMFMFVSMAILIILIIVVIALFAQMLEQKMGPCLYLKRIQVASVSVAETSA